jgi:hypothetical protein
VRFVGGQVVGGKDGMLRADIGAVAAVDALVRVDKNLGYGAGSRVAGYGRNGRGGALRNANKILGTSIGNNVSHKMTLLARNRAESTKDAHSSRGYRALDRGHGDLSHKRLGIYLNAVR